ncbi:hypothetical protein ACOT81_01865 [Streptomyces sp. WI04-05B]|uniref:hypothetical protein n=1 Tax=Streptomyces TaxID=1883 RepID=UPI0029A1D870|nr:MULTISPECIES: hypothetical protein [unclassified Streptomyces]MDX2541655.1 hypothetical protein [Streptomyces sp. WI04-05B]MDX2583611.1 hypothetical protein [Streptomyces sp. WI04-05A]MDX3745389.1 hypothetical protein [Streptomyces sp. AK08-02]
MFGQFLQGPACGGQAEDEHVRRQDGRLRPKTPANPRLAEDSPLIVGARMLPTRPSALDRPVPLAWIQVGKTSGL